MFDYIIVGQGICGTMLSWNLIRLGKKVLIIDNNQPHSASRVASGIINPVTGRRIVATWMIEELLPFAWNAYASIGNDIGTVVIEQKDTIVFPPSYQMKQTYDKRLMEEGSYVYNTSESTGNFDKYFDFIFGSYAITPSYLINLHSLLDGWRKKLIEYGILLDEAFDDTHLNFRTDIIEYKQIKAHKIIYCNGIDAFKSVYWKNLPYVYNKGQALIAEISMLPAANIYKFGAITIAPWYNDLWWVGSSYENEFQTTGPTADFRNETESALKTILKIPFTITDHYASLRPATIERRPFVGLHPHYENLGILNGMGTKGCSLAPWFARELAEHLVNNKAMNPLSDIRRFYRMLTPGK